MILHGYYRQPPGVQLAPGPIVRVALLLRDGTRVPNLEAFVDPGCDFTSVWNEAFAELQTFPPTDVLPAAPPYRASVEGYAGARLEVERAGWQIELPIGIAAPGPRPPRMGHEHILLGRDVLDGLVLVFDGPRREYMLWEPRRYAGPTRILRPGK